LGRVKELKVLLQTSANALHRRIEFVFRALMKRLDARHDLIIAQVEAALDLPFSASGLTRATKRLGKGE